MNRVDENNKLMETLNKDIRERHTPKWVVTSPNYIFISNSKEELQDIMWKLPPYQHLNACYRFPATGEDFFYYWKMNKKRVDFAHKWFGWLFK